MPIQSVLALKTGILSGAIKATGDFENNGPKSLPLNKKTYYIRINTDGTVESTKRDREGVWDKIWSAVCDFFGMSTSKRLVKAYNAMIEPPTSHLNKAVSKNTVNEKVNKAVSKNTVNEKGKDVVIAVERDLSFVSNLLGDENKIRTIEYKATGLAHIGALKEAIEKKQAELAVDNVVSVEANVITYRGLTDKERGGRKAQS